MAPHLTAPVSVRDDPGRLDLVRVLAADLASAAGSAARDALARPGSVGLIAADARVPELASALDAAGTAYLLLGADEERDDMLEEHDDIRLSLVPASIAKGLEFDWVVVVEPAEVVAAEPRGLRRLYVVLTRAVSGLAVVHADPLPTALTS